MGVDGDTKYQYLAGLCVNIIAIANGAFCGWPSASFLELQAADSPLETGPMTNNEAGWVGAMFCVGGLLGTVIFAWAADKVGRKRSLLLTAVPSLIGWVIIPFAVNPTHLAISRLFGGLTSGGIFAVIPIYITELAEDKIRGILGTFLVFSCNAGVLIAFVVGYYLNYIQTAWSMSILTVLFLISFVFFPETPAYLMNLSKVEKAEQSLRYFRNLRSANADTKEELKFELEKLHKIEKPEKEESEAITWHDFTNHTARKAFLIGFALMALNQLCGCFAMINYTASIFKQAGSNLTPKFSAIVVGVIQLFGSYMSTVLVERAGRKLLLIISAVGTGLGHVCLGSYSYLNMLGYDTQAYNWIPVASFSFIIFIACWGVLTLPFLVVSEILPPKIRNMGNMICMVVLWIICFFILKYLPTMSEVMGMHGMMLFFGSSCFIGAAFIIIYVPETKGKSIETILSML
ncbi:facilitated trehalose transporter Tret1 [Teleopsis dalmanni]|uniref:facilitated trehalose transporter Tret1 n=1 Tax=Teleopsis dalmanni TaxID=139649 RepID=UPI0018CD21E7|nr:facilitated trehalose transporter Tret1 [Teleopsis dalmanni]